MLRDLLKIGGGEGGVKIELVQCIQQQLQTPQAVRWGGIAEDDLETSHLSPIQPNVAFDPGALV